MKIKSKDRRPPFFLISKQQSSVGQYHETIPLNSFYYMPVPVYYLTLTLTNLNSFVTESHFEFQKSHQIFIEVVP